MFDADQAQFAGCQVSERTEDEWGQWRKGRECVARRAEHENAQRAPAEILLEAETLVHRDAHVELAFRGIE